MISRPTTIGILFSVIAVCAIGVFTVSAQGPGQNMAVTYPVQETGVEAGDIIAQDLHTNNLRTTRIANSREMFGVVADNPLIVYRTDENTVPIVRSGQTEVNVTALAGNINIGDTITSSRIRGYGRRATATDTYKLGKAIEAFSADGATSTVTVPSRTGTSSRQVAAGKILVDINISPIGSGPEKLTREDATSSEAQDDSDQNTSAVGFLGSLQPTLILKYIVAAIVAVGSIYSSFRYFGSNLSAGVSSVGRNPMAKGTIMRMVTMNVTAIVLISLAGIGLAIFLLLLPV